MSIDKRTARPRAATGIYVKRPAKCGLNDGKKFRFWARRSTDGDALWPICRGFEPEPAALPTPRVDVPLARRERAALMTMAIAYGATPEDIVLGSATGRPDEVAEAFTRSEDRAEALAHVDLLLEVLCPG